MQLDYNTDTCRICLSNGAVKDIFDTKKIVRDTKVTCWEMMVYCFSTNTEYKVSPVTKLCHKCYTKLLSAYKLKHLALDSEKNLYESLHKTPQEILYNVLINSETGRKIEENENKTESPVGDAFSESEAKCEKVEAVNEDEVFIKNEIEFDTILSQETNGSENIFGVYLDENANADSSDDNLPLSHAKEKTLENFSSKNNYEVVIKKKRGRKKKDHGRLADDKKQSICDQCGKQVRNLKEHLRIHDANRRRISCEYCPKLFSTYSARYRHRAVQHLGKLYYCELCNKSYKSGKEHNAQMHSTRPRPFACLGCDKAFFTEAGLDIHMTVHTDEKRFECPVCQKRFRQKCTMVNHKRRIHDGEKSHICHHCSKAFFAIHHLQVHMRSHTKEKVYKCLQCQKMFSTTSSLHHHERRHTGDKRHACQFCNMKFFDNGALKIHLISHTKEKKFECRYCGVKFGRSDHRNRHEKTAHQNKKMSALLPE